MCIVGVAVVIGADFRDLFNGRITGCLLAFGAVFSWNMYNFLTARLGVGVFRCDPCIHAAVLYGTSGNAVCFTYYATYRRFYTGRDWWYNIPWAWKRRDRIFYYGQWTQAGLGLPFPRCFQTFCRSQRRFSVGFFLGRSLGYRSCWAA